MRAEFVSDELVTIDLNIDFYSKESIGASLKEYSDFLSGLIDVVDGYYILSLTRLDKEYTIEQLADEFMNYILISMYERA